MSGRDQPPGELWTQDVSEWYNPLKKQVYSGSSSGVPSGPGWTSEKPEAFIGWQTPRPPGFGGGQQQPDLHDEILPWSKEKIEPGQPGPIGFDPGAQQQQQSTWPDGSPVISGKGHLQDLRAGQQQQPPGGPPQASQPFVGSKAWGVQQRGEAEAAAVRSRKEAQTMGPLQQSPAQEHPQLGTQEDIIRNVKAKAGQQKPAQGGMWESPAAKQWKAGNQKPFSFSSPENKVQQRENMFRGTKAQRFQQNLDKRRGWGKTPPGGWRM